MHTGACTTSASWSTRSSGGATDRARPRPCRSAARSPTSATLHATWKRLASRTRWPSASPPGPTTTPSCAPRARTWCSARWWSSPRGGRRARIVRTLVEVDDLTRTRACRALAPPSTPTPSARPHGHDHREDEQSTRERDERDPTRVLHRRRHVDRHLRTGRGMDRHRLVPRELHHDVHREGTLQLVEQLRVDTGDVDTLGLELLHELGVVADPGADGAEVDLAGGAELRGEERARAREAGRLQRTMVAVELVQDPRELVDVRERLPQRDAGRPVLVVQR